MLTWYIRKNVRGNWTFERALEVAKKCKTRSEFQYGVGNKSAYGAAQKNGWLPLMYSHIEEVRKPKGIGLNKSQRRSQKYTSRVEFEEQSSTAYGYALRKKNMDDICSHMEHIGNRAKRCIYVIYSEEQKKAYIGLTFSFKKRMLEHQEWSWKIDTRTGHLFRHTIQKTNKVRRCIRSRQLEAEYVTKYQNKGSSYSTM